MPQLSDDRVRLLYQQFTGAQLPAYYPKWRTDFTTTVAHFASLTDQQLRAPAEQENLWRARGISGIGPGEGVDVKQAYRDDEIVNAIVKLRSSDWPDDLKARASALQAHYQQILDLVTARTGGRTPHAKLARVFTALLPRELDTCYSWKPRQAVAELILGTKGLGFIETGFLIRSKLEDLLGPATTLDEMASRVQFVWWLYENRDAAAGDAVVQSATGTPEEVTLKLWPATKQLRGIPAVAGHHEAFRATLRAAQNGATVEDIVATLEQDMSSSSANSRRALFNRVRRMGFLTSRDGLWYPSDDGEELLESDPPDILVQKFLEQNFGIAHAIRFLDGGPRKSKAVFEYLMNLYPGWTTNFMPGAILNWCRALGLSDWDEADHAVLSDYGREWLRRLPEHLPEPPKTEEQAATPEQLEPASVVAPTFEKILATLRADSRTKELVFDDMQVRSLHAAWHFHSHKRFVILSGLSGTGKTLLLREYARLYCEFASVDEHSHCAIVPVSPDWRDPAGLLGYLNPLRESPVFRIEPALRLLLDAARNPDEPFFLILDEMNLARVEQYFAPLLSAMETCGLLELHACAEEVDGVPSSVAWPRNLFIGGTVNMDESTHTISDKVLDRAFTFEFWDVDLDKFIERRHKSGKMQPYPEHVLKFSSQALAKVRRHFGYRAAGEFLDFVASAVGEPPEPTLEKNIVDRALFSKVLPRLRGDDSDGLRTALSELRAFCQKEQLAVSAKKLQEMQDRLSTTGLTRFWA